MSQYLQVHPDNPQARLLERAAAIIAGGGVVVYPTDSAYAIGCQLGNKEALERIRRIRGLDPEHLFTLMCRDLSEIATYATVDNTAFRLLKAYTPGPYTFILKATAEVPRRLQHPKRKTIGLRIPDNKITLGLLAAVGGPLLSSSLILAGEQHALSSVDDIREALEQQVDLMIDGGVGQLESTTVVDLVSGTPEVLRVGCGDPHPFQ